MIAVLSFAFVFSGWLTFVGAVVLIAAYEFSPPNKESNR